MVTPLSVIIPPFEKIGIYEATSICRNCQSVVEKMKNSRTKNRAAIIKLK
jgi:hypothetical protein